MGLIQCRIGVCYRITLEILIEDLRLIPIDIGDHDAIYRCVPWPASSSRSGPPPKRHGQADGGGRAAGWPAQVRRCLGRGR